MSDATTRCADAALPATDLRWWERACPTWPAAERTRAWAAYQADLTQLEHRLLAHGGARVAVVPGRKVFLAQLLDRALVQTWPATPRSRSGLCSGLLTPDNCHANSAALWRAQPTQVRIAHGYALSLEEAGGDALDAVWVEHSWGLDLRAGSRATAVIETTAPRLAYYGFVLTPAECAEFAAAEAHGHGQVEERGAA